MQEPSITIEKQFVMTYDNDKKQVVERSFQNLLYSDRK
jgi:hypothetical protein